MKLRLAALALVAALLSAVALVPGNARAASSGTGNVLTNVTGTVTCNSLTGALVPNLCTTVGQTLSFTNGALNITGFNAANGQVNAIGTLTGTLTNTVTGATQTISQQIVAPLTGLTSGAGTGGSCQVLTLDVGAIHLDLLGLVVDLSPIHLNITAQQGPGNLLGNLVCTVANLLNGNAAANAVAAILNNLLRSLSAA